MVPRFNRSARTFAASHATATRTTRSGSRSPSAWGSILLAITILAATFGIALAADDPETLADGPGAQFRFGHIEGQGVPQVLPITPVELFPYLLMDDSLFFSDLRFYTTNSFTFGGNVGFGYRMYSDEYDRIFGVSGWYDADNARDLYFQQLGLSLESYADPFDLRANFYLPVGSTEQLNSLTLLKGSTRFANNNILYSQTRSWYSAMKGLDAEAGFLVPGDFAFEHGLRVYGGGYHYSDDQGNRITGGSARIQANIVAGLDAHVQVMHDNYFETRGFVGVAWTFGALHRSELKQDTALGRIGEHVTRNYTVVAPLRHKTENLMAINPGTGQPYTVSHVSSAAGPGGSGTVGSPYQSITAAQGANRDFVFVHAGSIFNGPDATVVLNPGTRVLGDGNGVQHHISVPGLGSILVPHGPTFGNRPLFSGSPGDSIVLASNTEFAGFTIANAGGNAISANGAGNLLVRQVDVFNPTLNGINLVNTTGVSNFSGSFISGAGGRNLFIQNNTGDISFDSLAMADSTGSGIEINGGSGIARFIGNTRISNAGGPSVSIQSLAGNAEVRFADLSIDHRQGRGIEIENSAGTVVVTGAAKISNESNSTASAIDAQNFTGNANFNRIDITDATGAPGINLENNTGKTLIGILNVTSHNATAVRAKNAGTLHINPSTDNTHVDYARLGTINAVDGAALDVESTALNAHLRSVSSSNAANGIRLVSTTGMLDIYGNGTAGSGGRISNATNGIFLKNTEMLGIQWMTLDHNGAGIRADNAATVVVNNSFIQNSTGYGFDALNTSTVFVNDSTFTGNAGGNLRGNFDQLRSYNYSINGTELTSGAADNVVLTLLAGGQGSTLNLVAQNSHFTSTLAGSTGIKVDWNGIVATTVNNNLFTHSGTNSTGVIVNNAAISSLTGLVVTRNTFRGSADGDAFVRLVASGPTEANLTGNQVEFTATNGTGFRLALAGHSNIALAENVILDSTDGATGILFDSVVGPSTIRIENNLIDLTNSGALIDRGIYFTSVTSSTTDQVRLLGSGNNRIFDANIPFYVPPGTTTGKIFVNGIAVP